MSSGRGVSLGSIALVAVLSGSLGLWSAFSGPEVADVQLSQAAANLAAASSFVVTLHQTESVLGTDQQIQIAEVVHFQAPDRDSSVQTVESSGSRSVKKIVQIGSSCWISTTGKSTTPFSCTRSEVPHLLDFVKDLEISTGVTVENGTYVLNEKDSAKVISSETSGQFTFGMAKVTVRISGDYVSSEKLSLDAAVEGASILINEEVGFSQVGDAPAVVTPSGPPTATASS